MNRIRLLPEQVANQIAAGEVVERPASVVKELVENSLDAGARRIDVEIQRGGRQLIRVEDDGIGMSRDDALMCLERHATSKIRLATDLAAIQSMGFRGEALPSIASVSRFTLTTRERESPDPEATQVIIAGGKLSDVRTVGHPAGTTVEVRQLFHNLPARRKFLRSEETERAHIQQVLTLIALANPEVGLSLRQEDRLLWRLPPMPQNQPTAEGVRERLRTLVGPDLELLWVDYAQTLPDQPAPAGNPESGEDHPAPSQLRIWGFIGAPGVSRATRQDQYVFVNRRPIENRGLNYGLLEGYHTALMKGRYPVACLFLEIDPADVDVNVHPAKREVRFRQEYAVRQAMASAVRQALLHYHSHSPNQPAPLLPKPSPPEDPQGVWRARIVPATPTEPAPPPPGNPPATIPPAPVTTTEPHPQPAWLPPFAPPKPTSPALSPTPNPVAPNPNHPAPSHAISTASSPEPTTANRPLLAVPLRLVGVVGRLYVLLESDRGLVLMDQHAAHERVLFEQMLRRMEEGSGAAPSQRLLLPETVELSIRDSEFLRQNLEALTRLGVGLAEFGERTFLLDAVPPFVRMSDAKAYVREVIDALVVAGREVNQMRLGEDVVAKTVCRHAVKANDELAPPELEQLIADLRTCTMPYTCPHGRPTLIEMNYRELERKFGRTA